MKKDSIKKKLLLAFGSIIVLFILYTGFKIYQTNQMQIIPIDEIQSLEVSTTGSLSKDTQITGQVTLNNFEAMGLVDLIVHEDTLYLILYKWPAFIGDNEINFTLEHTEMLEQVNNVSVIYGDIYSGEGTSQGISYNDLVTHPEQRVIWEKDGRVEE